MREITTHKHHEQDRQPRIIAQGNVGVGGAEQNYTVIYLDRLRLPLEARLHFVSLESEGVTNEALLAIVIDRLEGFQAGPYACNLNADALSLLNGALGALKNRTASRMARGVENQAKP